MVLAATRAQARTPELAVDPREGVWFAAGEIFVKQARDRFAVFNAPAKVNNLAVDDETVWIASDDGVIRFESGSQRLSSLSMDDGLPSQAVSSVAVDPDYVWFGTNKGLARYRKVDRTIRVYGDDNGLPHRAVTYIRRVGRQMWFGTKGGLAVYDPDTDGLRAYTSADGLASDYVEELYQVADDLWAQTDVGLSRLRIANKRFTNFSFADIGGTELRAFVVVGDQVWVGTEQGLTTFDSAADAFIAFPQMGALESPSIRGIEPFTDYLFITTDKEVVQYHKINRSFRRFTEGDGIIRNAGAVGTLLSGSQLAMLFADGVQLYDIQRELWVWRALLATEETEAGGGASSWQLSTKVDSQEPFDLRRWRERFTPGDNGYTALSLTGGAGSQLEGNRSLDVSTLLDYGELARDREGRASLKYNGIRDAKLKIEYLGNQEDVLREVKASDALRYQQTLEDGVLNPLFLAGAHVRVASPGAEPALQGQADAGLRRGVTARDFLTGPRQEVYSLSQRYILPGSERVFLDGELLTSGTDYTVIYPAGQLAFLDPERVDDLSIIEVEYEYDVMPKKGLGVISLLDLLPADNEVGAWVRAAEPTIISEESGLYAQIDGAAPKYIDRGWVRSVYVEYRQGSRSLQLAIHDMGTAAQAEDLYGYDLPAAREPIPEHDNMILDVGLATSYAVKAHQDGFYVELSIDEKSDAAKQSLKLFAIQVIDRGENAGANKIQTLRELFAAARAAVSPFAGMEIGARAVEVSSLRDPSLRTPPRDLLTGIMDARYEKALADRGRFTAYAEAAGSHSQGGAREDGFAVMTRLRLAHPWLDGTLSGRYQDQGFTAIGSDRTLYGNLRDETRLAATAYPTRYLPTSVFFTRQEAFVDGDPDVGVVQHALARLQLTHPDLPATSLQFGHTFLDDATGGVTNRLKAVAATDYDLAEGILKPLGLKRFIVRGTYGISEATTKASGRFAHADRVQVARLEAKLAPTATETAYALFRTRSARTEDSPTGDYALTLRHWELNAGARSAFIPGLIPQVNQTVLFDDDRIGQPLPVRTANASIAGQLGIYPGEWVAALTPVAIDSRYSVGSESKAEGIFRTVDRRLQRVDNRMSYNGMGKLEVQLYEIFQISRVGETALEDERRLELRNRVVFRPTHASPITLRLDYVTARRRNDLSVDPTVALWGRLDTYEGALEWLLRWSSRFTTKVKGTYSVGDTIDLLYVDPSTRVGQRQDYTQQQVKPEVELRFLLQKETGSFFLIERNQVFRQFGSAGAQELVGGVVTLGVIWSEADNLYLDAEVAYQQTHCLQAVGCSDTRMLLPRILLTAKL
ncbi:MAG: hypothetical protein HY903_06760 [Deltaproteobacteria bacterium]|nr:hypothetical protein [Deltaproteobacteria bacterium]